MRHISRSVLTFFLFLVAGNACAINCKSKLSDVEILICKDIFLKNLDGNLNTIYDTLKVRKLVGSTGVIDQKDWVESKRNACSTNSCLRLEYKSRLSALSDVMRPWCKKREKFILGGWVATRDGGSFEDFSIGPDNSFDSWSHHRPEIVGGAWELSGCNFRIFTQSGVWFDGLILDAKKQELRLLEFGVSGVSIYKASL